jgi:hypothetical protein
MVVGCGKKNTKNTQNQGPVYPANANYNDNWYANDNWYNPTGNYNNPAPCTNYCGSYNTQGNVYCGGTAGGYNAQGFFNSCFNNGYSTPPAIYNNGYVYNPGYFQQQVNSQCGNSQYGFQNCFCNNYGNSSFYGGNGGTFGSFCGQNGAFAQGQIGGGFGGGVTFSW